jgi:hypothetical protein
MMASCGGAADLSQESAPRAEIVTEISTIMNGMMMLELLPPILAVLPMPMAAVLSPADQHADRARMACRAVASAIVLTG